jgi:hypothetical protein
MGEDHRSSEAKTRRSAFHVCAPATGPTGYQGEFQNQLPSKYNNVPSQSHGDRFMHVLAESLVSATVTVEHKYTALLLSIDGLQHPLLRGVPLDRPDDSQDFFLTKSSFLATRRAILECKCTFYRITQR